jgi:hypothetical protein
MNGELQQLLLNLKLKTMAARCAEYLAAAERDGTPVTTVLVQLLRLECKRPAWAPYLSLEQW